MIGQLIGQYKILEKLGEGGMGVVYKAHDSKLDRFVALKFLPHHLTIHDEERARFLQEARSASALNHPHVCVIHDLQEYNGEHFIVMEFVEGGTVREKISAALLTNDRVMPLDTVITYAIQIGEALQEAHSKGIVHRDVKAENIMVTGKNQIKVMDFGLAKLKGSLKITRTSSTVGTLAYMAPEQIQGGEADARSDIFSFGVVVYEMLAGQMPFRGGHEAAMMYSILNEDPDPIEKYRPGIPSELLHVLNRSLEKSPDDRYQSIGEMVIDLRRLKKQSTRVSRSVDLSQAVASPSAGETVTRGVASKASTKRLLPAAIAGLLVVVAAVVWYLLRGTGPSATMGKLNPNMTFRVLQIPFNQITYPGLSGDGNWIAFSAAGTDGKWDVYFMNTAGGEPRRVTSDSSQVISQVDISPDGSKITYDRFNSQSVTMEVVSVSSLGGASRRVAEFGTLPRWTPDGDRIGYLHQGSGPHASASGKLELWSVKADGNDPRREFVDSLSVRGRISFSWSPDGKSVAWIRSFPEAYQEVITRELASGKERQLTFDKKNVDEVCWTRQGEIIFSSNKNGNMNLWMVPANGGDAVQLTKGSGPDFGVKISADGAKLLYYQYQPVQNIWIARIDGSTAHPVTAEDRRLEGAAFSPDGKQIVFSLYDPDAAKMKRSIYIMQRDGSDRREITAGDGIAEGPQWSPDGKWIGFITHSSTEAHELAARVAIVEAVNPGVPRVIMKGLDFRWVDGKTVSIQSDKKVYLAPIDGSTPTVFTQDSTLLLPLQHLKYALNTTSLPPELSLKLVPLKELRPDWNRATTLYRGSHVEHVVLAPDDSYLLVRESGKNFVTISLPAGRRQNLPKSFPGLDLGSVVNISFDGREIVYNDRKENGKLVMIENMR